MSERGRPSKSAASTLSGPPVPKEHGAWALVYGPLAAATLAFGQLGLRLLLLTAAATALFLAHEPLSRIARASFQSAHPERLAHWWRWSVVYLSAGIFAGGALFPLYQLWHLPLLAAPVGALFAVHLYLISWRAEREVASEVLAVFGLTATAPIAFYVFESRLDWTAVQFWLLNVLYFSSGIFFVKMTVSRHVGRPEAPRRIRDCALYHAALLPAAAALGWMAERPLTAALAVLPIVIRAFEGIRRPPAKLNLKSIGYREEVYTVLFVLVVGAGFRWSPL